jgi:hypothetical protein
VPSIGFIKNVRIILLATLTQNAIADCPSDVTPDDAVAARFRAQDDHWCQNKLQGMAEQAAFRAEQTWRWMRRQTSTSTKEIVDFRVYEFGSQNRLNGQYRAVVMQDRLNFINGYKHE